MWLGVRRGPDRPGPDHFLSARTVLVGLPLEVDRPGAGPVVLIGDLVVGILGVRVVVLDDPRRALERERLEFVSRSRTVTSRPSIPPFSLNRAAATSTAVVIASWVVPPRTPTRSASSPSLLPTTSATPRQPATVVPSEVVAAVANRWRLLGPVRDAPGSRSPHGPRTSHPYRFPRYSSPIPQSVSPIGFTYQSLFLKRSRRT